MSSLLRAEIDRLREHEIEQEYQAMVDCMTDGNKQQARYHHDRMCELIGQRSPEIIAEMEKAKGLR